MSNNKTRKEIAHKEATQNPIFILLRGTPQYRNVADWKYDSDTEILTNRLTGLEFDLEKSLKEEEAFISWFPQYVFFTREEAEQYVKNKSHHYNYGNPRNDIDYMIYCSPAFGVLTEQLKK